MSVRDQKPEHNGGGDGAGATADVSPGAVGRRLDRVGQAIDRFRIDAERFFNGALLVPPEDLRLRIQDDLRDLQVAAGRDAADRFRLTGLEARFNALSELYGRRLRDREEGRSPLATQPPSAASEHDPHTGIVISRALDPDAVEALWQGLAGGGARLELDTFRGYLARQIDQIHERTGAGAVQFRVVREAGRLKLKAKPLEEEKR